MKLQKAEGFVVIEVDGDIRQYRDTNNAVAWLQKVDRESGLTRPRSVSVNYPEALGSGWFSGSARGGIESIRNREDRRGRTL